MGNNTENHKRQIALNRAAELKGRIQDYLDASRTIDSGLKLAVQYNEMKQKILKYLCASESDWADWRWQMQNRFETADSLAQVIELSKREIENVNRVSDKYRWAVVPYYVSLMHPNDPGCPIRKQAVPSIEEVEDGLGIDDPMAEEYTSPAAGVTRRYPDRLIINVTNQCSMYCRHCQRRRNIGEMDIPRSKKEMEEAVNYVQENPEIRDVLITGGDAFMLDDDKLDWLLSRLDAIEHVEIKRLGSRTLATMPQRITDELCAVLEKHHPVYVNTQFNHPKEVTADVIAATKRLCNAGVPLGNQTVLLRGINNDSDVMKKLNHELLKARIKPYYMFHAKAVTGTSHFITSIEEGIEIIKKLRGYTSGLAIPQYIVNAPQGQGKTPMLPEYVVSAGKDYVTIRTWEGKLINYPNKAHY